MDVPILLKFPLYYCLGECHYIIILLHIERYGNFMFVLLVINEEQYYYNKVNSKFYTTQIQIHFAIWNDIGPKPNKQVHNFAFIEKCMSSPVGICGYVTVYVYMNVWRIDECV